MKGHGAVKTQPVIAADTGLRSINITSCLRSQNVTIIPTLWLKIKEILRLCGTVSKRYYTGPLLLFFQTVQIKPTFVNTLCKFFFDKILKIRSTLQSSTPSLVTRPNSTKNTLSSFTPVSEESLLKILKSSPSKSCGLDPIPTSLVKECADILITPITKIVNYSIKEGSFPNCFKMAHATPLHKKPSLDRNSLKNYRPVSNLSFISKLIEKVVAKQLNEFISHEGLLNVNQSAYKSFHSTETVLLKIQNDIAFSVNSGKAVALTLLDLSAAFHTIDHSLLYDCLHDWFGLDGTVLLWIKLYLSNRKQKN